MISVPVGTDTRAQRAGALSLLSFAAAATLIGVALGVVAFAIARLGTDRISLAAAVVVALVYSTSELLRLGWPVPQRHWQIPQSWGILGRPAYAAAFGAILSAGFLTFIPFAGYYVVTLLAVAMADWQLSALIMTVFAWARVAPVLALAHRLHALGPTEQLARAVNYAQSVARINERAWLPRGALLAATAIAATRALVG